MSPREPRCHQNGMDARRRDTAKADALARSATTQTPVLVTTLRERGGRGAARCCLVLVCINTRRPRRLALRHAHPARGHAGS
jgi:hypothetical protein